MALAALGLFVFQLKNTPYQTMQINKRWRYGVNSRNWYTTSLSIYWTG